MKIRTITISIILSTFLILSLSTNMVSRHIFSQSFDLLEHKAIEQNVERALNALKAEEAQLQTLVNDWAWWDDTYKFVVDGNQDYIESNLVPETFEELELNIIAMFNIKGEPVWFRTYDLEAGEFTDNPAVLPELLIPGSTLEKKISLLKEASGLIMAEGKPMLMALSSILDSSTDMPSRGILVMGKYISAAMRHRLADRTKLDISLIPFGSPDTPKWLPNSIAPNESRRVEIFKAEDAISGHALVFDMLGDRILSVLVTMPRDIHSLGQSSLRYQLWAIAIIGVILCATMFILLELRVISRISSLTKQLMTIRKSKDSHGAVELAGHDDISNLSSQINAMMTSLREKELFLTGLLDSLQAGVVVIDLETRQIVEANPFALEAFQRKKEDVLGKVCHGFICPNLKCPIVPGETPEDLSMRKALRADGSEFSIFKSAKLIVWNGRECLLETFFDVSQLEEAKASKKILEQKYQAIFKSSGAATFVADRSGLLLNVNDEFVNLIHVKKEDLEGQANWRDFFHKEDLPRMIRYNKGRFNGETGVPSQYETRLVNYEGETRHVTITVVILPESEQVIASMLDITDQKMAEKKLAHQAFYDTLTGLPNRALFMDRLEQALRNAEREDTMLGVLMLDLDDFKHVNDTLGHSNGDEVLVMVANRLKQSLRDKDTIARVGGDEFMLMVDDADSAHTLAKIAGSINKTFTEPFSHMGRDIYLGFSIGIAVRSSGDHTTPDMLLQNADMAMYQSKNDERNSFSIFSDRLNKQAIDRLTLESELHKAIDKKQFILHYQPKIELETEKVFGAEALIRWVKPDGQVIPPDQFIPLAETTGLIVPMDLWALEEACNLAVKWHDQGCSGAQIAVNLSARHFKNYSLPQTVAEILERTGLSPHCLNLEITETSLMHNFEKAISILKELNEMGVGVSLDDFGTGYSSLYYLRKLPIQTLKIDRNFVWDIKSEDSDGAAVVRSILSLAQNLNLKVVAEGVETWEQVAFLKKHGCKLAQGFLFSKPVSREKFSQLLKSDWSPS